ncbi:MAG: FecR family protein, partial [Treponema sp.]|nr:FecR family protein [Treponema sp.]
MKQGDVKKDRNFHLPDLLVLLICLAGAFCSLWFFRNDLNQALTRMNEQPVGIVTYKYRAAQRRFVDRVLWSRVQRESPVYNGDYIRTAELSEANISFNNGALVSLSENSMIQVFLDAVGAKVDFARGGISVNAEGDAALLLSSGTNLVAVRDGAVNAAMADGGFDLSVTGGQVSLITPEGEREAGSGSAFSFLENGGVESPPQAVVLAPAPAARLLNSGADLLPVEFVWNKVNYSASMVTRIEIARDRAFQHTLTALEEPENDRAVIPLPSGSWWWRVSPVVAGESGEEDGGAGTAARSTGGKLVIVDAPPPAIISPAEGDLYRYQSKAPELRF